MPATPSTRIPVRSRLRRWRSRRVEVRDESMFPTLRPGDRLLVDLRAYRDRPPKVGEIVVIADPLDGSRWLVKRVVGVGPGRWWRTAEGLRPGDDRARPSEAGDGIDLSPGAVWVLGDALDASRDSRRFGPVPSTGVVGRVYRCYAPAARRREL